MVDTVALVKEFHERFEQPVNDTITIDNDAVNVLRIKLLVEEVSELEEALDKRIDADVLDALVDIQYVLDGAFLSLGFAKYKDAGMLEAHRSNMTKLGADGKPVYNKFGKVIKGPNFEEPDFQKVIDDTDHH